jgi:hypothetical protein
MFSKKIYSKLSSRFFKPRFLSSACDELKLNSLGINNPKVIHHNLSYPELLNQT